VNHSRDTAQQSVAPNASANDSTQAIMLPTPLKLPAPRCTMQQRPKPLIGDKRAEIQNPRNPLTVRQATISTKRPITSANKPSEYDDNVTTPINAESVIAKQSSAIRIHRRMSGISDVSCLLGGQSRDVIY